MVFDSGSNKCSEWLELFGCGVGVERRVHAMEGMQR